jgi:acetyltransferase-like isoleucine patch superfamily enzyme
MGEWEISIMKKFLHKPFKWLRKQYIGAGSQMIYPPDWRAIGYTWLIRQRFRSLGEKSYIRPPITLHHPKAMQIGNDVFIREHAWLNAQRRPDEQVSLMIGDGTYIGRFAHINAFHEVIIETNVLIADRVFISDVDHSYNDPNVPIMFQTPEFKGRVLLCAGCWIGIGAVILSGIRVGKNAVVGANAVVTHDVPDYAVVGGVPAKQIR